MKRYKAIVEGVEKFFNVTPDRYDAFIAKHPDAVLVEGPETEEDSKADTEILSTVGNPGFQKDTAESADVVSEDVAQNDMDLLSANGSLELQNQTESFSIDNKKVTKEEFDAYSKAQKEKNLTGEEDQTSPLYIEDVIERNNISEEIKSIDNSLQDFSFSATDKGIEAIERRNYLQTQLDLTVNNKLFSIYEMPEGEDKNNATLSLSKDQQKTLDAVEEIAKDTGAKSATDKDTVFKKFDAAIDPITGLLKDLGRVEEVPTETYKYTEEVFDIVATKVSNDNTTKGRANFNALDFSAKEKIITESRAKAFDNITKRNKNVAEDLMKQDVELQQELVNYTNKLIDENSVIKGNTPDDKFTQAQVEAFNINVGLINQAVKEYNIKQENLKKEFKNIQNSQDTLAGTYKISEATGKIKDTFKKTQEIRDFKKEASAGLDGYAQGINSLTQGVTQIFLEGSIGWTSFLLGKTASIFQDVLSGDSSYNQFDAFVDIIDNNIAYDVLGVEASKAFTPGRDNTGADFAALAGDIIPFSFYLITQAKKGNISGIENAIGKISRRKPVKDVLSGADKDMITAAATVRALALGNYTDALDQGLSKSDAFAYSSALTIGTMGVQMIMPDYKFLNGKNVTNALAKLPFKNKGLGTNAAAKAGYEASKQFVGGMAKEFGEEEMEVGFQRLLNTSFALANSEFFSDEWWKEQKQLVAGVGMLSSGLGSVGSYKTATDVYAETIRTNQNKIKNLKFELFTTKTKLEEAKANGVNIPQQSIDEVQASIDYATRLDVAITQSPNNVTGQELAMLVEKNTLLDEKKNLDEAYHGPINKRISEIDQEIAESRSTTFIKGALEKDIKFSEELSKDLDLKGEIKTFNNEEELNSFQESIKDDIDGVAESTTGYGTIINLKDGSDVILINKGKAFAQGRINTTAHELLHRYLRKLLKGNEYDIKTVGEELSSYYDSLGLKSDLEFEGRRLQYEKKYGINSVEYNEEVITLLSEAMLDKKVKETEGKISKLISAVKGLFSLSVEEGSIELNDGKSVFNFVKEFNKSVKAGKASKNLKAGTQGATGSLIKAEGPSTTNTSKQSLDLNTGAQQELDAALQALEEAEAVLDEDFDNPQSQKAVDEAEAAFNAVVQKQANQVAGIEEESAEEVVSEEINEVAAKDFVKTKKDPSTKKRSLTPEVKSVIEKKIVKAKTETDKLVKKQKAAIDKKLKEIDALPSSEMERTPKAALKKLAKNNPVEFAKQQGIEVPKPAGLAILEKEISEDLKVPIEKFVNSVGVLFYKMQKPQVRDTVDLNTFLEVVRGDVLSLAINEFKKKTVNRQGEEIINDIEDIIFSRGGLRIRDISERLITGKEKTSSTKEIKSEEISNVKKIKPSSILAGTKNRYNRAKDKVKEFWAKNKDNEKVRTFKGLKSVIDEVTAEIFGVSPSALSARSGNLNKPSMDNALKNITEPLNVVEIRNANGDIETARVNKEEINEYINDLNRRKLLEKSDPEYIEGYTRSKETTSILDLLTKFFPKSTVPEYFYADGDRGDKLIIEKDTGIGNKLKEALYVTKERGGLGSGNTLRDLSDVTFDDMLDVIGAYKDTDGVFKFKDGVNGRSPEGLRLLELVKLTGKYITNELSRTEAGLDPMTIADLGAGKNAQMFSNELPSNFFSNDKFKDWRTASNISIGDDTIDELAKLHEKKRMSLLDVGNALMEKFKLYDDIQVGRKFRAEFVKILEKEYPNMSTKIAQLKALKDLSYAFGEEFKYITQEIAFNNEWSKIENIKENKLSKEEKVETINNFIKRWSRATRNLKLLGVTRNDQLFKKIGEASGLGKKGLNDLRFTTGKEDNLSYIRYNGINLYGFRSTDSIKKSIQKGGADRAAAVVRVNTDARLARETMYEVIDEFIANEDFRGAYAALALAREDMNGLLHKVSSFGKYIALNKDNKLIMEHETDVQSIYEEYIKYIDQKGSESAKNKLDGFLDKAYVNLVSADLNALLDKNGGPNRYNAKEAKRYIAEAKIDGIYEDYLTENVELAKSIQKFLPKILRNNSATLNESLKQAEDYNKALLIANSLNIPSKGISVWDFDDTLAQTKSNVLYTMPDGSNGKLTAEQFAKDGDRLIAEGAEFDFSEFSKVVQGSKGPFFEKAMARNKKFGNKNVFILTARPANSATAIHEFLKGIGLNIPLDNITGLANSSPQAKANWVVSKAAKGYNDFYFADDHIGNVKAVKQALSVLDVKSKVQQARVSNSLELDQQFNMFLETSTGIESFKKYKSDKAKLKGRFKGKLDIFIPPSAEDFLGLLYQTLNKGKLGETQMKFYEDNLLKPYAKANSALRSARVRSIREFDAIKKKLKIVPKDLKKSFKFEDENGNMKDSLFSKEQAIRVYIWNAQGIEMPNLSQVDLAVMVNHVNAESELKAFADELLKLNRGMKSKAPSKNWMDGNIGIDLQANLNSVGRKKLLEVWQQNVDAIFSEENLNKLEAAYGPEYVKALENSLRRMRTGRSAAPVTDNEAGNNLITWLNSAVGNIMFFNNRSALLQMLSATNFLNFEDNNIIAAGKALMNIKQYSKDFVMLMNSDYLVDRRDGTRININEADIALIAKQSGITGVIAKILELGFLPTKFADSLAIATGGATFYRTKVDALRKGGMSKDKAEAQAMQEFISVAETSQQSSDQSKISMEQAGSVGKIILAFNNTSSQYSRIIKRSVQDLYNRRGSDKANLARIVYYGGMQNLLFNFMQQAMFAAMWGGEDDEEVLDGKKAKIVNSMADGLLRGMGVKAAIFVAIKNTAIKLLERSKKDVNKDYRYYAVMGLLSVSPPLSSKASKLSKAASAFQYGKDKMKYGKFGLDSPELAIGANLVSFATSLPTDRLLTKAINVSDALDASNEPWERLFMTMGWPKWTLSTKKESDLERKEDKTEIKEAKEKAEFDAMTPLEQKVKALENLKKFQQVDSLKAYGLTNKEIRLLTREEDRINKILSLEGSEKKGLTPADKAEEELYDLKKKQQVDSLTKYGLTKKQIRDLKYEEDRVNEILRLRKKQKKIKDTLK